MALTPPHRFLGVLRSLDGFGPAGAAVALAAATYGDRPAIIDEIGSVSFAELDARSNALANAFRDKGVHSGDGLGIMARNHRGLFESILAGAKLGARTLLLNTDFAGPQLADVCKREEVTVLVHDEEFTDVADSVEPSSGKYVAWFDGDDPDSDEATVEELIRGGATDRPPKPDRKQRIILLTSGTTGTPKGAPRDMSISLALPGGYLSKIPLRSGRTDVLCAQA